MTTKTFYQLLTKFKSDRKKFIHYSDELLGATEELIDMIRQEKYKGRRRKKDNE